jgi:hypothetical protein
MAMGRGHWLGRASVRLVTHASLVAALGVAGLGFSGTAHASAIRPPFDATKVLRDEAADPFVCPTSIRPLIDMSNLASFYVSDSTQSVIDPAALAIYVQRVWPANALLTELMDFQNRLLMTSVGRADVSACIVRQLRRWADAQAMLGNIDDNTPAGHRQAVLVATWTGIAAANAYVLATAVAKPSADDATAIKAWFQQLSTLIAAEFTPQPDRPADLLWLDMTSNHSNWGGAALGLFGGVNNDVTGLSRAIAELHKVIAAADPDGALPVEIGRGALALQYQSFAMLAISILVAEADANGIGLPQAEEVKLQTMARFTLDAFNHPETLAARVGVTQVTGNSLASWMEVLQPHMRLRAPSLAQDLETTAQPLRPLQALAVGLPISALVGKPSP